jgi:folylpolyglutamate synthase
MREWLRRTGYTPSDLNALNAIHIAGSKGKGSTSAMVSFILSQYEERFPKVGLYTSPHLRSVRERIQINNRPLSEASFTKYFFQTWDALEASAKKEGADPALKPAYFRFLTLMAFHTFISEKVSSAIIEVGIGGEYDSTNLIPRPSVVGISTLAVEHAAVLGGTIETIAWHKAGIIKDGVPSFISIPQMESALKVVRHRAQERNSLLTEVEVSSSLERDVKLNLEGDFQRLNASLAASLAQRQLELQGVPEVASEGNKLPERIIKGLEAARWPGRCDRRLIEGVDWFIDGSHTVESIGLSSKWFAHGSFQKSINNVERVLIFNQQIRVPDPLLLALYKTVSEATNNDRPFDRVIFTQNNTFLSGEFSPELKPLGTYAVGTGDIGIQENMARAWQSIESASSSQPLTPVKVTSSIEEAVSFVRDLVRPKDLATDRLANVHCFITGSLHLVGGALEILEHDKA